MEVGRLAVQDAEELALEVRVGDPGLNDSSVPAGFSMKVPVPVAGEPFGGTSLAPLSIAV